MANHIKADGTETEVKVPRKKGFNLTEIQGFVGGYFELVHLGGGRIMAINEEAHIHGHPYNGKASRLAGQQILGDVLVCNDGDID